MKVLGAKRLAIRASIFSTAQHPSTGTGTLHILGDTSIYFLDGATLLDPDAKECSVDGVHQTDLGFFRMAKNMAPAIRSILVDK